MSRLPEGFVFPRMTFATLLASWFCGNQSKKTIPSKLLRATELENKREKFQLCKMRTLIDGDLEQSGKECGTNSEVLGMLVRPYGCMKMLFIYLYIQRRMRKSAGILRYNLYVVAHGSNFAMELVEE